MSELGAQLAGPGLLDTWAHPWVPLHRLPALWKGPPCGMAGAEGLLLALAEKVTHWSPGLGAVNAWLPGAGPEASPPLTSLGLAKGDIGAELFPESPPSVMLVTQPPGDTLWGPLAGPGPSSHGSHAEHGTSAPRDTGWNLGSLLLLSWSNPARRSWPSLTCDRAPPWGPHLGGH